MAQQTESPSAQTPNPRRGVRASLMLLVFIGVCFAAAAVGSSVTTPALDDWYANLNKPDWNPPNAVFGPVWSVLFLLMAMAGWLIWKRRGFVDSGLPLSLFAVQLAFNVLWSVLFFGLRNPGLAFADVVCLWLAIAATLVSFWRVRPLAGALLVPYLGWVSYAAALNVAIWQLNA